jgi:heterodisulfide reductase subunit B
MVDAIAETTVSVWVTNTDARLAIRDGDKWGEHEATVVINFCPFCGLQIVSESADIMKEVEESVVIPERVVNKVKLVKVDADG